MHKIVEVPIENVFTAEHSVRAEIKTEDVNGLISSISRIGIVCPIVVQADGERFKVVFGHRRFRAACLANLKTVPCIVRDDSVSQVKEIAFAENFFRADLSPVEQAAAIKDVIDTGAMTVEQVATGFHRSTDWIVRQVSMLSWPPDVLSAVHEGWISVSAASNLALVEEETYREFLLRNARESGVTARVSASWLQAWRSMAPPEEALESEPVPAGNATTPA
ncbi:MAG: ParB/RepB/Spo0J family partition protein, partial [Candidatus Brocadiales bacterium]|nr:ParB/RepB/Spo0J family partition protein [Candidatus Bathyanammoxibius sp.]